MQYLEREDFFLSPLETDFKVLVVGLINKSARQEGQLYNLPGSMH